MTKELWREKEKETIEILFFISGAPFPFFADVKSGGSPLSHFSSAPVHSVCIVPSCLPPSSPPPPPSPLKPHTREGEREEKDLICSQKGVGEEEEEEEEQGAQIQLTARQEGVEEKKVGMAAIRKIQFLGTRREGREGAGEEGRKEEMDRWEGGAW